MPDDNSNVIAFQTVVDSLRCPACGGDLRVVTLKKISCSSCKLLLERDATGVFDFLIEGTSRDVDHWNDHWRDVAATYQNTPPSKDAEKIDRLVPGVFDGALVVDAGSGTCRNLESLLSYGPAAIIFTDLSTSLCWGASRWRELESRFPSVIVLFIRADIYKLPFKRNHHLIIYMSSGIFNILEQQIAAIECAMSFSEKIFILYNSPCNPFGKFFYSLNPWRKIFQLMFREKYIKIFSAFLLAIPIWGIARLYVILFHPHLFHLFTRKFVYVLTYDWLFSCPPTYCVDDGELLSLNSKNFSATITENAGWISRILSFERKEGSN